MGKKEKAMTRTEIWFPAKRYGWGWGFPCAWQGWAVLIAYVGLIVLGSIIVRPDLDMKWWVACIIGLSLLLIVVCAGKKGKNQSGDGERRRVERAELASVS